MAKSIDVSDLDIYYGDFLAVEGVNMTIKARSVTAFIGPSGCGKSTMLRSLNRMHEVIPGARVEGKVMVDGQSPLRRRTSTRSPYAAQIGMVFQRPNPFPTMSIYDNVLAGNRLNNKEAQEGGGRRRRGEVAEGRQPLERGQGPAQQARHGPLRWPAAAPLHRPRHRRRAARCC